MFYHQIMKIDDSCSDSLSVVMKTDVSSTNSDGSH